MIASNRCATAAVRDSSPERVAARLSSIQASSSGSTSAGQPSHTDWARTAYTEPRPETASSGSPGATPASRPSDTSSSSGARAAIRSAEKNGSSSSRASRCAAPSRPLGTCRNRDTWLEYASGSVTTATASACRATTQRSWALRPSGAWCRAS
ncbi:MAG: hypothetical protein R2719_02550 [Micropruina sp.]